MMTLSIDPAQLELLFKDMPEKPETSPGEDAPEEDASDAVDTPAPKKRAAHRSRITVLENLPVETTKFIPDLVAADPDSSLAHRRGNHRAARHHPGQVFPNASSCVRSSAARTNATSRR